jgi:peptide deformylase
VILELVKSDSSILKQKCELFDFKNPQYDPEKLADPQDLKESMIHHRGIGLSACQVGIPLRVFAVGDPNDPDNIAVMFNPRIVDYSET